MTSSPAQAVTQLLLEWRSGNQAARDQLMPLVYDELRRLAAHYMRAERPDHTRQATALVNEAYLHLIDMDVGWQNRAHFFAVAVRADDEYRKRVAIKVVRQGLADPEVVRRFRNERQILASLDHPNIARLLDGGTTANGMPYVVIDYIEGEPIDKYCDSHRLTIDERLRLFRSVCAAVHYAHQNLIIHRDIKPGNILVTADGVPKLLDFGIAKLLNPELGPQTQTVTRMAMRLMTPEYASPEQIRGEPITTASDIYSLGVVLYELLTGCRPYRFNNYLPQEIEHVISFEEPEKPSTVIGRQKIEEAPTSKREARDREKLRRQLAGELDAIVMIALRKEPQRRYASAEQLSDDIRRHLEGRPVRARPDTMSYRAARFVKRHKVGVAAAALVLLTLMAASWRRRGRVALRMLNAHGLSGGSTMSASWPTRSSSMYTTILPLCPARRARGNRWSRAP